MKTNLFADIPAGAPQEIFTTLLEAQVLVERWRKEYNEFRPHSALGYRPPAPEAVKPKAETLT